MIVEEIQQLLRAPQFVPFSVHLTDGTTYHVPHLDYAWLMPHREVLYVYAQNQGSQRIAVSQIVRVQTLTEQEPAV